LWFEFIRYFLIDFFLLFMKILFVDIYFHLFLQDFDWRICFSWKLFCFYTFLSMAKLHISLRWVSPLLLEPSPCLGAPMRDLLAALWDGAWGIPAVQWSHYVTIVSKECREGIFLFVKFVYSIILIYIDNCIVILTQVEIVICEYKYIWIHK